ncbi:cytochrome P450 9e2-like [Achroia grisella]|uniref:cytochrome P450 9e2-like n=1 Tax=Achroia grisella TaxID=688607 RepID=UPI0027D21D35|nr:cytochrome P450 9e2-like [Achroia grisella]
MNVMLDYFKGTKKILQFIMEDWMLLLILTAIFAIYFYYTSTFDYFEKRNIKFMKPTIFVGNMGRRLNSKQSFHAFQLEIYNYFKGRPFGGFFEGRKPVLYVLDADLIKAITIRDFDCFVDRNTTDSRQPNYLRRSLLILRGTEWKGVRSILTPAFSSARLKNMLPLLQLCSSQLVDYLKQYDGKDIDMKDTLGHYTLETIGACAFGIKCDALTNENAHFVKVAEKFNDMSTMKRIFILSLLILTPQLLKYLNISFLNQDSMKELVTMLKTVKAERRSTGVKKNDFLQLLIDAAETEKKDSETNKTRPYLDDDTLDAQSLLFLLAGYETSSTVLSFAVHVLATKPELQEKLRAHVEQVTNEQDMSYDLLSKLTYLEGFLLETLRMYPPVSRVDRKCVKQYTLPGTSVNINVDDVVAIPIYGIHMDPEHYPEPHEFRPERFMGDEKNARPSHLFLAFGAGPRNCIGLRFAMFSAKLAMVSLLKNFKFTTCPKTREPIEFNKRAVLLKAEGGLWVRLDSL